MKNPFAGRSFFATFGTALAAILLLFAVDTLLARSERAETSILAASLFRQGRDRMMAGDNAGAVRLLKDAIATERGNREYQRTLAEAQLAAGKTAEAELTLSELLQSDSTDGPANLIMGRVLLRSGRFDEAVSYFHRSIFGRWKDNAEGNRLRVRFELIDLLAARNSKEELLAELLPLEDRGPHDQATRLRMGRLFLAAGSPVRAASIYRAILHDAPASADAYAGMGETEFAQGNYPAARRNFEAALRFTTPQQASYETAQQRLDLCNEVLLLDPTARGIGTDERFRRSLELVKRTLDEVSKCIGQNPPPEWQALADKAGTVLSARRGASRESDLSESNLVLCEQLWQLRRKLCKSPASSDSPLALAIARLAR